MVVVGIVIAGLLSGLGVWVLNRRLKPALVSATPAPGAVRFAAPEGVGTSAGPIDGAQIERVNRLVTERLWKLAFAAASHAQLLEPTHNRIRDSISAALQADALEPKNFPRRPTLLPQLLRAVDDPQFATDRLSRIVAHDPVLTSDVLRLANSSLYRIAPAPIETIQRAIVVLGVDALRGLVANAMLQPVFRATRSNFPRFPRMLWERTERAACVAEFCALRIQPQDRFEAQLAVLLSALGPLMVYGTTLDVYSRTPQIAPNPTLCVALTAALGPHVARRIAAHWETSPRLIAAIEKSRHESLTIALCTGELLGTLSLLVTQNVITREEAFSTATDAGVSQSLTTDVWARLSGG